MSKTWKLAQILQTAAPPGDPKKPWNAPGFSWDQIIKPTTMPEALQKMPAEPAGTRVSPQLIVTPAVLEALKRLDALGLNMADQATAIRICSWLSDDTIAGAVGDMNPQEYQQVYTTLVKGTPPPTKMGAIFRPVSALMRRLAAPHQDMIDLLRLLFDAGFRMDDPKIAAAVLAELGTTNSVSAPLASQMGELTQNPQVYADFMNEAAQGAQYQNPPVPTTPSSIPGAPPYSPVIDKEKQIAPDQDMGPDTKTPQEMIKELDQQIHEAPDAESRQPLIDYQKQLKDHMQRKMQPAQPPAPAAPPTPAQPASMGMDVQQAPPSPPAPTPSPAAPPATPPAAPPAPAAPEAEPQFQRVEPGTPTGIPIFPGSATQKTLGPMAKGGDTVVSYTRRGGKSGRVPQMATVLGVTPDKKLAVQLYPSGTVQVWDPVVDEVRVSMAAVPRPK